jgi:hypothetical protein
MSSQPEEEELDVEDGELITEEDEELEMEDEDEEFFQEEDEDEGMDLAGLMTSLLATPDGDTVCSALVNLCYQLETQNKILIKMLAKMQSQK